jgi:predicted ATPase
MQSGDLRGKRSRHDRRCNALELDRRIDAIRDNIRQLIEQAAAYSGAADEARTADRITEQEAKLEALLKERDALAS